MTSVTTSRAATRIDDPQPAGSAPLRRVPIPLEAVGRPAGRDALLDLLRGIALIRVVIWHTFSSDWMTAFAAMPVMFFVVGTMLPDVRTWRAYLTAVRRRGQRVLMPYWAYGAVIWGAAAIYALTGPERPAMPVPHWSALNWIVPLDDPTGATFHGGWLSSHLWYLRAYVWVILGMPLLAFGARRIRFGVMACVAAVIALEVAGRDAWPVLGAGTARLLIGDFVTYGLFVVLGIWFANRRRAGAPGLSRRTSAIVALTSGAGAIAFWRIAGLPGGEVNNSYPALVLTGLAWLAAAQAAEGPLRRLADRPAVARRSQALSGRALTVYLWHPAAIVVAHRFVDGDGIAGVVGTLAVVAIGTVACVGAFGWLEDRARPASSARTSSTETPAPAGTIAASRPLALRSHRVVMPIAGFVVVAASVAQLRHQSAAAAGGAPVTDRARLAPSFREALRNDAFPKLAAPPSDTSGDDASLIPSVDATPYGDAPPSPTASIVAAGPPVPHPADEALPTSPSSVPAVTTPSVTRVDAPTPSAVPAPVSGEAPSTTIEERPAAVRATAAAAAQPGSTRRPVWTSRQFQALLDSWLADNPGVGSVTAAVVVDGQVWTGESHQGPVASFRATDRYAGLSLTKTFTAALVLQAVDRGLITLDEDVPALPGVDAPDEPITVRELLTHTSGLVDYTESPDYDRLDAITPLQAVNLSTNVAFRTPPGAEVHYANTNYLYLELLLEQRTGRPFSALMADLVGSVGLQQTTLEPPDRPGWAASGSGGIYSNVSDLAEWIDALFTPGRVLSADAIAQMVTLDSHNIGLGTWPICPCWTDDDDVKRYTAIGHHFRSGGTEMYPASGISVAARIDPPSDAAGGQAAEIGVKYSNLVARLNKAAGRTS